jgi:hypothetical protein
MQVSDQDDTVGKRLDIQGDRVSDRRIPRQVDIAMGRNVPNRGRDWGRIRGDRHCVGQAIAERVFTVLDDPGAVGMKRQIPALSYPLPTMAS